MSIQTIFAPVKQAEAIVRKANRNATAAAFEAIKQVQHMPRRTFQQLNARAAAADRLMECGFALGERFWKIHDAIYRENDRAETALKNDGKRRV